MENVREFSVKDNITTNKKTKRLKRTKKVRK